MYLRYTDSRAITRVPGFNYTGINTFWIRVHETRVHVLVNESVKIASSSTYSVERQDGLVEAAGSHILISVIFLFMCVHNC